MNDQEYLDYMKVITNHASVFIMVRLDHLGYLKGDGSAAIVLSYLINQLRMKHDNENDQERLRSNGLWFKCPLKDMQKKLHMTKHKIPRILDMLKAKEIAEISKRGVPQTMWVRISAKTLENIERWGLSQGGNRAKSPRKSQNPGKRDSEIPESGTSESRKAGFYCTNNSSEKLLSTKESPPPEQNNSNSEQIHTSNGYSNGTHHHNGNGYHLNGTTPHLNGNGNSSRSNGTLFPKTKGKRSSSSRVNETGKLLKPKAKYSDFCYQLQDKFRELLRKYGHKPTDWTREKGAKSIHDLLTALDGDEERISEVIRWYPRNADVIERPKDVFSIHTLCGLKDGEPRMFLWLESLMKDDRYEWIKRTSRVVEFGHKYNEEGNCSYRTRTEYED